MCPEDLSILSREELKHLQVLCRIGLSSEEEELFLENIVKLLRYIKSMDKVDTDGVEECIHIHASMRAPLREDIPESLLPKESLLKMAPEVAGGFVKVPKVVGE